MRQEETTQAISWAERLSRAISGQNSLLCVGLDPVYEKLPARFKTGDVAQDIFAYNRDVIDKTAPYAAAFKPQYKCYSAEGEAGVTALRLTCHYIKSRYPSIPVILDAKYADIGHVLERCAHEAFELLGVDAVTAMPQPGRQALAPLISRPGKGCFMVVRTSNPGAAELQDIPTANGDPLYLEITRKIASAWNDTGSIGLVAPATDPAVLAAVRQVGSGLPILCPGVGAQGGDVEASIAAGLDQDGGGLLINVSRAIMEAPDPAEEARAWRDKMQQARGQVLMGGRRKTEGNTFRQPATNSLLLAQSVIEMFKIGAIRFEPVTLKSGLVSPYYNNLRILTSYPDLLKEVAALMAETMRKAGLKPDIVIGIAEAGIPLAVALSQQTGIPGGYARSSAKTHGTRRMVEGAWPEGAIALLVDDVVSDGASKLEVLGHLQEAGLQVHDIVVVVDRGQGGVRLMAQHGLNCHAVLTMDHALAILLDAGLIDRVQVEESRRFMREASGNS